MNAHGRRQQLLALVYQAPGISVPDLAAQLGVSQGTIRNDLNALAKDGLLVRVHGGAKPPTETLPADGPFAAQARVERVAKESIARGAAHLVADGDSILIDASTTAYHLARALVNRRKLTVVTSGLDAARVLAANLSNTVILLGGVLNAEGTSVSELPSAWFPSGLHIKTAFLSCAGFTPETGLTEVDIRQTELKRKLVERSSQLVALVDSSKFGVVGLASFAQLSQISHIFTDDGLPSAWIDRMRAAQVGISLCGSAHVVNLTTRNGRSGHYKIGFANLGEQLSYAADVRRSVEQAAQAAGGIDLVLADNRMDGAVALQAAGALIAAGVDLVIEYQLDHTAGEVIMARFQDAGIPVVAVDIPMVGATFYGVDNYRSGHMAGVALGLWIARHWDGRYDRLISVKRQVAGPLPAARMRGQVDGLGSVLGPPAPAALITVDCSEGRAESTAQVLAVLRELPQTFRLAVVTFSDSLAVAAAAAGRALGRQANMAVVGQGADRELCDEMASSDSPVIGATAFYPERYGEQLITLALKVLRGERVPPAVYIDHTFVSRQ